MYYIDKDIKHKQSADSIISFTAIVTVTNDKKNLNLETQGQMLQIEKNRGPLTTSHLKRALTQFDYHT